MPSATAAGVAACTTGTGIGRDHRVADLGQLTRVDVFRSLLAADVSSATTLRVAWPSPLPTVPTPAEAFPDGAGRPVDAFDFGVHQALSTSQAVTTAQRCGLAGVVELSGDPAAAASAHVHHARSFRQRTAETQEPRFVVIGTLDDAAVGLLEDGLRGPALAAAALDGAASAIGRLHCTMFHTLDLSRCESLTELGDEFLYECKALPKLTLPSCLKSTGTLFCSEAGLEALDLSHCTSLTQLGGGSLSGCMSLRTLTLPASVTSLGESLCRWTALEALDLSHCASLTRLDVGFLVGCKSLRTLVLPASVTSIDDCFCQAAGLESLDLSRCTSLTTLGGALVYECEALRSLTLPASVTSIGSFFGQKCGLEALDLSHCKSLTQVGERFLALCESLHTLALPASLTSVGPRFCMLSGLDGIQPSQCIVNADGAVAA